jgi:PP-loop superfamily ATP-utilizing enzyme
MESDKPNSPSVTIDSSAAWVSIFQELGLPLYRVRVEGRMACIEAPLEDFPRLLEPELRRVLVKHGKSLGYLFVTLDLG